MGARDLIARGLRAITKAVEGEFRPGPYTLSITGGWLPDGTPTNFWQMGMDPIPLGSRQAMVEACVGAYSQTMAMCPGSHWRKNDKGGRDRVENSALSRILKQPNEYQTSSDFMLNAVRALYLDGNAYALALRNSRYEVEELHLMDSRLCRPVVAGTGDVFYHLAGNAVVQQQMFEDFPLIVPQRDVLHIRLHADRRYPFPLWGQTPLLAALADMSIVDSIAQQQINFYLNQARPSAVLSTDLALDKDQVQALRDRWDEQTKGLNQGKVPILTAGLKVQPWSVGGRDAQIADMLKMSKENIALVFRVPLAVLGLAGGQAIGSGTEAVMNFWIATGLGFCLNHVESAFDKLFGVKGQPDEYTEFSTEALLRSAHATRIEALARGVQGGIYSPNEARNMEDLDKVKDGDEPRVQQQVVPLSAASQIEATAKGPKIPGAPTSEAPPSAASVPIPKATTEKQHGYDSERSVQRIFDLAERASRRFS